MWIFKAGTSLTENKFSSPLTDLKSSRVWGIDSSSWKQHSAPWGRPLSTDQTGGFPIQARHRRGNEKGGSHHQPCRWETGSDHVEFKARANTGGTSVCKHSTEKLMINVAERQQQTQDMRAGVRYQRATANYPRHESAGGQNVPGEGSSA